MSPVVRVVKVVMEEVQEAGLLAVLHSAMTKPRKEGTQAQLCLEEEEVQNDS